MSLVEFKKTLCRPVEFKGFGIVLPVNSITYKKFKEQASIRSSSL